jgi:HPt (histidine-containing phosphotransfer) domain-containing protein
MDTLEQKISAGDPSALKHAIHTLKGTAGNISANQLADEARLIELQIIQDETPSTTDLARLEECLNETINSINLIIASADPIELDSSADVSVSTQTEEKQLPINNDLLLSQLQQLDQLLQSHDLSAKQILQLALPSLTQKIDASQIESLTLSIDHLDFSTAQRQLNSIRGEL